MNKFYIRNIFVDLFLKHYFQYGFNIGMAVTQNNNNYIDDNKLHQIFNSINSKIRKSSLCDKYSFSFLNLGVLLNLDYKPVYPVVLELTQDEQFWFELVVNLSFDGYVNLIQSCNSKQELRRLYSVPPNYLDNMLSTFNNKRAVEYIRLKYIHGEHIGNEPARTGFFVEKNLMVKS